MNTIELMLEALKSSLSAVEEQIDQTSKFCPNLRQDLNSQLEKHRAAIVAEKYGLRRRLVGRSVCRYALTHHATRSDRHWKWEDQIKELRK